MRELGELARRRRKGRCAHSVAIVWLFPVGPSGRCRWTAGPGVDHVKIRSSMNKDQLQRAVEQILMATERQRQAARRNVKKAQAGAKSRRTLFAGRDAAVERSSRQFRPVQRRRVLHCCSTPVGQRVHVLTI